MGKEAKIGLGIISILLIVLGVVVFRRVWGPKDLPDVSVEKPTTQSGAGNGDKSTGGGTTLIPAKRGTQDGSFGPAANANQWVGSSDRIEGQRDVRDDGALGQPRTAFMPKTGSPFGSGTPSSQGTEIQGESRFGRPTARDFNNDDFGTGRNNVLRPSANDGALSPSSRRPLSETDPRQADLGLGGLRPTDQALLQPGPKAAEIGAESTATQAQYAAQQPYGTPRDGSSAASALGGASSTGRYGTSTYGASTYGGATARDIAAGDIIAGNGGLVRNSGSYTVQPNDSFWLVSKKVYGSGDFYKALIEHNRKKFPDPSKIRVGDVVATPDLAQLRKNYPVFCPKQRRATSGPYRTTALGMAESRGQRVYVVQEGDTVFNIARDELGKSARWAEICRLNRDLLGDDYDHLKPGWKLLLPGSSTATTPSDAGQQQDTLTRQIWQKIR